MTSVLFHAGDLTASFNLVLGAGRFTPERNCLLISKVVLITARSAALALMFFMDLNINSRVVTTHFIETLRLAIDIHHLVSGRESVLF